MKLKFVLALLFALSYSNANSMFLPEYIELNCSLEDTELELYYFVKDKWAAFQVRDPELLPNTNPNEFLRAELSKLECPSGKICLESKTTDKNKFLILAESSILEKENFESQTVINITVKGRENIKVLSCNSEIYNRP